MPADEPSGQRTARLALDRVTTSLAFIHDADHRVGGSLLSSRTRDPAGWPARTRTGVNAVHVLAAVRICRDPVRHDVARFE
jgi:hypothetical protein